ncbi:MAG: FAD:protein FMN transferase, partial [Nocardiopsaceae bacterium]|nr:FAD:protein FMN transferase [Nocardiopsaceae bacterium]
PIDPVSSSAGSTAAASWQALGLLVQIVVTDPGQLSAARELLAADLAELDQAGSRFRPDSEVSRLSRAPAGPSGLVTATVSPLLAEALAVALRAASLTDGDVDPTVGGALSALGYDRDFAALPPPSPPGPPGPAGTGPTATGHASTGPVPRVSAPVIPGWRSVTLDPGTRQVTMPPGVQLDLGATVKAWAADRSAARIAGNLSCGVLVSLGGDTAVAGPPPEGGWRIRVQDGPGDQPPGPATGQPAGQPTGQPPGPTVVIAIRDGGLATSSVAARRWSRGGSVLHHILDPRTGLPAAPVWRTVSVAAASCADANTAATAAIIRGWQAPDWLASLRLPARLVEINGPVHLISGWPE